MPPYADAPTIILGTDGFLGCNLLAYWQARGWPVHAVGRAAGDFTDAATVDRIFRDAPTAGRILHAMLTPILGRVHATRTAATIGRWFAILLFLAGLLIFLWDGMGLPPLAPFMPNSSISCST